MHIYMLTSSSSMVGGDGRNGDGFVCPVWRACW